MRWHVIGSDFSGHHFHVDERFQVMIHELDTKPGREPCECRPEILQAVDSEVELMEKGDSVISQSQSATQRSQNTSCTI
jgi:hypothetical protein